jgi:hypothetical protein
LFFEEDEMEKKNVVLVFSDPRVLAEMERAIAFRVLRFLNTTREMPLLLTEEGVACQIEEIREEFCIPNSIGTPDYVVRRGSAMCPTHRIAGEMLRYLRGEGFLADFRFFIVTPPGCARACERELARLGVNGEDIIALSVAGVESSSFRSRVEGLIRSFRERFASFA